MMTTLTGLDAMPLATTSKWLAPSSIPAGTSKWVVTIEKARSDLHGAALASDAYFPFSDGPQIALDAGITAIIQPGGSVRDPQVVEAIDAIIPMATLGLFAVGLHQAITGGERPVRERGTHRHADRTRARRTLTIPPRCGSDCSPAAAIAQD